jgi:hypothetical protein
MKINYGLIIGAIVLIFLGNHFLNTGKHIIPYNPITIKTENEQGDIQKPLENKIPKKSDTTIDYPETTTISQKLSKLSELLPMNMKYNVNNDPLQIVRNKMNQVIKNQQVKTDTLSPNPIGTTEYKFIDENPKYAWSDINVSQHPEHYKSNFTDELTNSGGFFDNDDNNSYHDRTSYRSKTNLPDRCFMNQNNEVLCTFNNKLQNIPPTLIEDKLNNQVLNSIGQGRGDIYKGVEESNIKTINGNSYQTWDYEDEKTINGGDFGTIQASSAVNEDFLTLKNINERPNYSI